MPAAIGAIDDIDPPSLIAAIAIIIARPKVTKLVEGQLLRVSQAGGDNLKFRPIRIAPHHRSGIGVREGFAGGLNIESAVGNAEIEFAIRTKAQAMKIVA